MRRIAFWAGFVLVLGGLLLLAFTQVTAVFQDSRRTEIVQDATVADPTFVFFSSVLIAAGLVSILGSVTPQRGWTRVGALACLGSTTLVLLLLHLTLFINAITIGTETDLVAVFTAGYLFHNSPEYGIAAVFLLFLITVALLAVFVASLGVLLVPGRFARALWDPRDWAKNEAIVVVSGLILVFSLSIYLVTLVRIIVMLTQEPPQTDSLLGQNLAVMYSLLALAVGALILTVAARVFLVNWGVQTPLDVSTIRDSLTNVLRVERVLVVVALVFDALIWMAPAAGDTSDVSQDPVFSLSSRGLAAFFLLLAVPFLLYSLGLRRLNALLDGGHPFRSSPFSQLSLRMVVVELAGLVLLTAVGVGARWNALGLMAAYSAWTAGVFLFFSVRLRIDRGLWVPELRGRGAPPVFFAFLVLSLATGLMLWGAGNTYIGYYQENGQVLNVENASPYGAELLFRLGGACLIGFTFLFGIAAARVAMGLKRILVGPQVASFFSFVVVGLLGFSVGVWNAGESGLVDAYAGYAFHQFYDLEKWLVGILVVVGACVVLWGVSRLLAPMVRGRPTFLGSTRVR